MINSLGLNFPALEAGLYLISVPIGNLGDITLRALNCLSGLDVLYCEDTRVTRKLLGLYKISMPKLIRCDQHNMKTQMFHVEQSILDNKKIGYVCDAGTPLISDPGYDLVQHLIERNLPITVVPGACAAISALSISGIPADKFTFLGFPPKKKAAQLSFFNQSLYPHHSYIFYERAERVVSFLENMEQSHPSSKISVIRELTKKYENIRRGSPSELIKNIKETPLKGEIVICVYLPKEEKIIDLSLQKDYIIQALSAGKKVKEITKDLKNNVTINASELYDYVQNIKDNQNI